jgi:hypothetical protein
MDVVLCLVIFSCFRGRVVAFGLVIVAAAPSTICEGRVFVFSYLQQPHSHFTPPPLPLTGNLGW